MKNNLRYIIAAILAGSLGTLFLPVMILSSETAPELEGGDKKWTIFNFWKAYIVEGDYFETCVIEISVLLIAVIVGIILSVLLKKKKGYIASLICSIAGCVMMTLLYFYFDKFVEKIAPFYAELGYNFRLEYRGMVLGSFIYIVVSVISLVGIVLWRKPDDKVSEEIYLEQIRQLEEERKLQKGTKSAGESASSHDWEKNLQMKEEFPGKSIEGESDFYGAILGHHSIYRGLVYPMRKKTKIFFQLQDNMVITMPYKTTEAIAGVYYIEEYGEYCIEPYESKSVFLKSGQPLGKGRKYYLPRETMIYIQECNNQFTLA